jgi:hypothetical protein
MYMAMFSVPRDVVGNGCLMCNIGVGMVEVTLAVGPEKILAAAAARDTRCTAANAGRLSLCST